MSAPSKRYTTAELLTPAAVAAVLFVDPKTVTRWARAGKIHSIRTPGGHRRYRRSDVYALRAGVGGSGGADIALESGPDTGPAATPTEQVADLPAGNHAPWAATELADALATALQHEADAALEALWLAHAALDAARDLADDTSARAHEARARADAEHGITPEVPKPRTP